MKKSKVASCCSSTEEVSNIYPDHTKELHRLNRISGQIEGVKRMISNRQYCPKIIIQIQAARSALKALESIVLEKHLKCCVQDALSSKDRGEAEKKIAELMDLFARS